MVTSPFWLDFLKRKYVFFLLTEAARRLSNQNGDVIISNKFYKKNRKNTKSAILYFFLFNFGKPNKHI
jgi:hypothetical protein